MGQTGEDRLTEFDWLHDRSRCPDCGGSSCVVKTKGTRRRRQCSKCGRRWGTLEVMRCDVERFTQVVSDAVGVALLLEGLTDEHGCDG